MSDVAELGGLRSEARAFAREFTLAARARELDQAPSFPWREFKALGLKGWLGPRMGRELGGGGWGFLKEAALIEELAENGGSVFAKLVLQPEFSSALRHAGKDVVDRWFRPLIRGEVLVGNQVTEPGAGSDVKAITTMAELEKGSGGEHYILTGTKSEIAFAADANAGIVYAKTAALEGKDGITAFLVPQDARGVTAEIHGDMGERWMRRGEVHYDRVKVPAKLRIGEEGAGFGYLLEELTEERTMLAVIYLALARASLREVVAYARGRKIFGRALSTFEGVSFPLVEDSVMMKAAGLYVTDTLNSLERGKRGPGQAATAKWLANTVALRTLDHAIQFHGGRGYSTDLPHEQRWRDVRSGSIAHGSSETMKMVAAKELFG